MGDHGPAVLASVSDYVLASLVNLPQFEPATTAVQLEAVAVVVVAGVLAARLCPSNAGPVLFAATVFLLYYGFLTFSPLLSEEKVTANARASDQRDLRDGARGRRPHAPQAAGYPPVRPRSPSRSRRRRSAPWSCGWTPAGRRCA